MTNEYKLSYTATQIDEKLGKIDNLVATVNGVSPDKNGNVEIQVFGGNVDQSGLTAEQISALDGMFKICAYTADATNAYKAFQTAFGIGGEVEPDEPDVPVVPDEPDEPIDTSVRIAKTGYGFTSNGQEETTKTDLSISEYYHIPDGYAGKLSYFFPNNNTTGIGTYMKVQMRDDADAFVEYWSISVGDAEKTVNFMTAASSQGATKFRFSIETASVDDAYMYYTGTGDIVFAGKNTKYYGMRNISEYAGA